MHPDVPTWHLLGAGALGCLWAAHLGRQQVPVTLLLKQPSQLGAYRQQGGVLLRPPQTVVDPPQPAADLREQTPAKALLHPSTAIQQLLVCTKAYDVEAAIDQLAEHLSPGACVVLFQNGLGPQERIAARYPKLAVYAASTTEGAFRDAPFCVTHAGRGHTWYGPLNGLAEQRGAEPLATLLALPLQASYTPQIQSRLWQKFAINCAINGLTAIHRCPNGRLAEDPEYRAQMAALCRETQQVAAASGIRLDGDLFSTALSVAQATAHNRSSMLQDLEAGRRTEMPFINGYLCEQAQRVAVAVPTHQWLVERVQQEEAKHRQAASGASVPSLTATTSAITKHSNQ